MLKPLNKFCCEVDLSRTGDTTVRRRELAVFLFFTVILAPVLSIAIVGSYGFAVWMYQLFAGPPTG